MLSGIGSPGTEVKRDCKSIDLLVLDCPSVVWYCTVKYLFVRASLVYLSMSSIDKLFSVLLSEKLSFFHLDYGIYYLRLVVFT